MPTKREKLDEEVREALDRIARQKLKAWGVTIWWAVAFLVMMVTLMNQFLGCVNKGMGG